MLTLKKHSLAIAALIIASSGIAMNWNTLLHQEKTALMPVSTSITSQQPASTSTISEAKTLNGDEDIRQPLPAVPDALLKELMAVIIEQGLEDGTYTVETLPIELRPFVRLNPNTSRAVYEAVEEITAEEEERIAAIEAMFEDDYVPPEPEFICPDPQDPGPQWQGSHARMILEEKGCTVY
jgi:hypothetical protein